MSQDNNRPGNGGARPAAPTNIVQFPVKPTEPLGDDYEGKESEYLVDIDTHHAILVVARSVDEAAAKALSSEDDIRQTTVAHDVHVCVHSGISDNECDHENGEETD